MIFFLGLVNLLESSFYDCMFGDWGLVFLGYFVYLCFVLFCLGCQGDCLACTVLLNGTIAVGGDSYIYFWRLVDLT